MKKQKLLGMFLISTMLLCSCAQVEKDTSYDTDLYGTYKEEINATNTDYEKKITYILNKDNTYTKTHYEKNNGQILYDDSFTDKINSIKEIDDNITKIELSNGNNPEYNIYKYKNILGDLKNTKIPEGSKFDLFIPYDTSSDAGLLFDKKGYYHTCSNYKNCTDDSKYFIKYKCKNNIIYQKDSKGNLTIMFYILNDNLFYPKYFKE